MFGQKKANIQPDQVIRSKRKSIGIEIKPGGVLLVRAPLLASDALIQKVLHKRAAWINSTQARMRKFHPSTQPKRFVTGEEFWYLGKPYLLSLTEKTSPAFKFDPKQGFILARSQQTRAKDLFIAWYRRQTRSKVSALVESYIQRYHFEVTAIRITSARTRWGSCSGKNALNFTYRLVMAPAEVLEYVVVHELVHTRVKNHSKQFWDAVSAIRLGYKQERAYLKAHGLAFTLD